MSAVWGELKRRNVVKVAVVYAIVGWLLVQIASIAFPAFLLPVWTLRALILFVMLGFPIALVLAWAFDLTPEGIKAASTVESAENVAPAAANRLTYLVTSLLVIAVVGASVLWFSGRDARWAKAEALPQIDRHLATGDWEAAYALAEQVRTVVPDDPSLADLWPQFSWVTTIPSDPPGARVYRRAYSATDDEWEELGTTPLEEIHFPFGLSLLRFELEGHRPLLRLLGGETFGNTRLPMRPQNATSNRFKIHPERFTLDTDESLPEGKVRVPGWTELVAGETTEFRDFYLGRHEVTNREFKEFVDSGGYERRSLWEHQFIQDGRPLSWEQAMALFTDRTGRPGPSTWEAGDYPDGQADYPVTGVNWYEAAAYARSVGQDLPTVHQWRRAYAPALFAWILPASNLAGDGPAPVGQFQGLSWPGTYDMAGNVREWCFNSIGDQRFILGGGWNDSYYLGQSTDYAQPPLDRSQTNGFRLAITRDATGVLARARLPLPERTVPDATAKAPVSDEMFGAYRSMYAYDPAPPNAEVEATESARSWTRERISFDAAYGGERMLLYLYLPSTGSPPYQTVLYWPDSGAQFLNSIDEYKVHLDFVLKSGRAVAFPVLKETLERRTTSGVLDTASTAFRDLVIQRTNDVRRSIDYLETRADIDAGAIGYFGYSFGAAAGPRVLTLEPRFRVAVLYTAPLARWGQPEIDPVTFLPRVKAPVLILGGEFDNIAPLETDTRPFFQLLGTPDADKQLLIAPGGHFVPRDILIRETLSWLDKHLGPPSS